MACARVRRFEGATHLGVLVLALMLAGSARADAQSSTGTIVGVVRDTAGAVVPAVTLRLAGTETRRLSDARGRFVFGGVMPGRYRLTATYIGAKPAFDSVEVRAGDTTRVSFTLVVMPFVPETLPPRFARGTRPDTTPAEAETIDRVARLARLPLLRAHPPTGGRKELRLWSGGGIAMPMDLVRLTIDGDRVQGEQIVWVMGTIPDRDTNPGWRAVMDSVPTWLHEKSGCPKITTDTLHFPEAQPRYQSELLAVCTRRFRREPDWRALLRQLESHHVWTLPDASELPTIGNVVSVDGGGVTVEAWDGARYHTYSVGATELIPAPEARELDAIQRVLVAFFSRIHEDRQ